jgi:hypothetical protein
MKEISRQISLATLAACVAATPAPAAEVQIVDVRPGQSADVFFEVNLSGRVYVKIVSQAGLGCADLWWITWPLGNIRQAGRKCGSASLEIPGLSKIAVSSKLRAGGVSAPTKIVFAATAQVANSVTIHWP